ncbi:hypothetical protein AJ85_19015 [Alkalihalobacillus alcalophilus ATCC 27647 = CGMCC 1.3604]|uniref:HNH domain-containing protein n=1 Tax=Alkalihalobacillus alcalophilus ATCC 27647 = CGMCC 1.3604 TaxID=1218173 RepID=A0A4V3X875_ALKAL|nr:HNH endonuclease [Alkalihalobacillus alcalophilus]MED1562024.1 HNH endonuclease [Alkalihalobacillus alcalophilus]THG89202.1 hypothetical protein AJ85_19015 [Alkalihalobacillus alcalophilus ATCC 27647 = CGMCC 1.3604]
MKEALNYYPTNVQSFTVDEWFAMLQEDNCFSPILMEAIYTLMFEMDGSGSAKQISEITGRPYQTYNRSMVETVKNLRNKGYIFVEDIRKRSKKERYWSHFYNGYYKDKLFIWEIKDSLHTAFTKFISENEESGFSIVYNEKTNKVEAVEGIRRQRIHYQVERNSVIVNYAKREFVKKNGSLFCEACNFSFKKSYGIDFIEGHHVLPLYMGERITKGIDLMMLCANCHRAVHSKKWNDKPVDCFLDYMKKQMIKTNF